MRQRARQEEDKVLRRESILKAAEALFRLGQHSLPSASAIAGKARLAKGTLYLYFQTKEEIYLAVLERGLAQWISTVREALSAEAPTVENVLRRYVRFCAENPNILFLAGLSPVILERNISEETAYRFKKGLAEETRKMGELMARAYPKLSPDRARSLFIYTYVLTLGLWQHTHPPRIVEKVFKRKEVSILQMDFQKDLFSALESLWRGSL
jgi:TetR/AcrR family transcriptional regulator